MAVAPTPRAVRHADTGIHLMHPAFALALAALAFWDAVRLLAGRLGDGLTWLPLSAVAVALAWPVVRKLAVGQARPVSPALPCVIFASYGLAALTAPPLVRMGITVVGLVLILRDAAGDDLPAAPAIGLGLLALPVLPSLEFFLAYPLRLVSATLTAGLLAMNGINVGVDGVALDWNGDRLLFDAACAGVKMLWAALLLVSAIALVARFGPLKYARAMALAVILTIAANALRAASLFYLENGFVPRLSGPVAHEAVGIAAFMMVAGLLAAMVAPRRMTV
ncbi:exosortase/archaeosortase family protein [Sphingomonas sp. So64.6b]|uniref:exosortase/archaeosortase family protein n=1 Tax=Sphingomonas sp. So64.6b TaxID=2997354 RepID=UPI001604946E|nr:exosortase/archaeosortase family protein [Sphingomonas sp. So64.6b]QNA85154.1 exosortase/archaeosortase family protein [Sphingomonas sp. So64.6b]